MRNAAEPWTSPATRGNGVELMAVYKRKYNSGTILWYFKFQRPGAARGLSPGQGVRIRHEAGSRRRRGETPDRRTAEVRDSEGWLRRRRGASQDALDAPGGVLPSARGEETSAQDHRAIPRAGAMPRSRICWQCRSRTSRRSTSTENGTGCLKVAATRVRHKTPRPLSAKTVRNIAGVVSSAFHRAVKWGLVACKPRVEQRATRPEEAPGNGFAASRADADVRSLRPAPGAYRCSWSFRLLPGHDVVRCWRFAGRTSSPVTRSSQDR